MNEGTKNSLVFNSSKCEINIPSITFYSCQSTDLGIKPDPSKIQSILDMPATDEITTSQSFLSTHMSHYMTTQEILLQEKSIFYLDESIKRYKTMETLISKTLIHPLAYFNHNKPAHIQADTIMKGLRVCLLQRGCPIGSASRLLMDTEVRCTNIHL